MMRTRLLFLLPLATLSCLGVRMVTQPPGRRLPIVDEMPFAPEQASGTLPWADLVTFYPGVEAVAGELVDLSRYVVECSVPVNQGYMSHSYAAYFTLLLRDDRQSAFYARTERPVKDISEAKAIFNAGHVDSGFIYDRNGDGWADYFTYWIATFPIETPEIAAQVPKRPMPKDYASQRGSVRKLATPEEARLMTARSRPIYLHCADDNFDGRVDAVASALMDPDRWGWVQRRAVIRSRTYSLVADEDWTFVQDVSIREGPVPKQADGSMALLLSPLEKPTWKNLLERFSGKLSGLSEINEGLRYCHLPKGTLPRE